MLKGYLPDAMQAELDRLVQMALEAPPAWVGKDAAGAALALLPTLNEVAFEVVPGWECGEA